MALNGWQRLGIVTVAAWALGVLTFATLEYHGSQGQLQDGIFTCGEPIGPPQPPATRYWDRDCGLFARGWVGQGLFDGLPPYRRYLNLSRFLLILLGPEVFVGLCIVAVRWIISGFRAAPSEGGNSEPSTPMQASPSAQPGLSLTVIRMCGFIAYRVDGGETRQPGEERWRRSRACRFCRRATVSLPPSCLSVLAW